MAKSKIKNIFIFVLGLACSHPRDEPFSKRTEKIFAIFRVNVVLCFLMSFGTMFPMSPSRHEVCADLMLV